MKTIAKFEVLGDPRGQPRGRTFKSKSTGKMITVSTPKGTRIHAWREMINWEASQHRPDKPIEGPVLLKLDIILRRPKNHFRTGRFAGQLKPFAPKWHIVKPDDDNCERPVKDCLENLGFYKNDSQVCWMERRKMYGPSPMIRIVVVMLEDGD